MTEEFSIRNRWVLAYNLLNLVMKVLENRQKKVMKVAKYSTFCAFLLQQKVNGTHSTHKIFIGVKIFDSNLAI